MFVTAAAPGKMKHSYTGLRPDFPNLHIHDIINDPYKPGRRELVKRPSIGTTTSVDDDLLTYGMELVDAMVAKIRHYTLAPQIPAETTLKDRRQKRKEFIARAVAKNTDIEQFAAELQASHTDEQLEAAELRNWTISFDFTGADPKYPQPTPSRVPNDKIRGFIVALDAFVVRMTQSHSAHMDRGIIQQESAAWVTDLADILTYWRAAFPTPFHPTNLELDELERVFNADASRDPAQNEGLPPQGDQGIPREGSPT